MKTNIENNNWKQQLNTQIENINKNKIQTQI